MVHGAAAYYKVETQGCGWNKDGQGWKSRKPNSRTHGSDGLQAPGLPRVFGIKQARAGSDRCAGCERGQRLGVHALVQSRFVRGQEG